MFRYSNRSLYIASPLILGDTQLARLIAASITDRADNVKIECDQHACDNLEVICEGERLLFIVDLGGRMASVLLNEEKVKLLSAEIDKWLSTKDKQRVTGEN
ncbi:hypothetical protein XccvBFoX7_gp80 [Xanthomonas phage FoX7]|uniref:Uncharacterized protein n=2 Tax=Carpasinavirus XcP1 TaxID=2182344 RepID=A0A858NQ18_9CAUD|nr:hypothetical protein XccvBFoX6_gp80 [Xanthomonas phage FoX6]QJB22237.1 hypothetical protein XccvBFoX7_gp80 [Xanthomonas phage FoX7]